MRLFDLLALENPSVKPDASKIHLATWNGSENPLDVYLAGKFNSWQQKQTQQNFEREYVVSLIRMHSRNQWLLAGVYRSISSKRIVEEGMYQYELDELSEFKEFAGRLIAEFARSGRQSYLNAENWSSKIYLSQFLKERYSIGDFPGYRKVDLTHEELQMIIKDEPESWRTALSNVAGVYLISDTEDNRLYVGSVSGKQGFWQRWLEYARSGHGGNVELQRLIKEKGLDRAKPFRYSILEITDIHTSNDDVLKRESHWKKILLSRAHGLNSN